MILSTRQRRRTACHCLLAWCLMVGIQLAHGVHAPDRVHHPQPAQALAAGSHSADVPGASGHSMGEQPLSGSAPHHCHSTGANGHSAPHAHPPSPPGTPHESAGHDPHSQGHSNFHQLMECDCLLCKLVLSPAMAPPWQTDVLVQRSLQADPDSFHVSQPALPRTQPPGRAPPL